MTDRYEVIAAKRASCDDASTIERMCALLDQEASAGFVIERGAGDPGFISEGGILELVTVALPAYDRREMVHLEVHDRRHDQIGAGLTDAIW